MILMANTRSYNRKDKSDFDLYKTLIFYNNFSNFTFTVILDDFTVFS